jgi:SAM-dependent methyltransferase
MAEIFTRAGLSVDLYDRQYATRLPGSSVDGDVACYLRQARLAGGPVLELATGTGRVALPLAAAGFRVTGVDSSRAMLAVFRRKLLLSPLAGRITLVRGDMRTFTAPGRYPLALIPFRAFHHLWTVADQVRTLRRVRRHLRPGGRLIVDLFDPRLDLCAPEYTKAGGTRPERFTPVHRDPATGRRWGIRFLSRRNDPVRQLLREEWRYEIRDRRGRVLRAETNTVTLRWTYRHEMRHLLERTGFRILAEYSDFNGSKPAYGKEQIWIAERA